MAQNVPSDHDAFFAACAQAKITLPYDEDVAALRTETAIGRKRIRNRIVYQAMEGCDGTAEGTPGERTRRRYLRFSDGGPGVIWFEATAVAQEGRANPRQLLLNPDTLDPFKRLVAEIKERGIKQNGFAPAVFCQLTHSGRYSKPNGFPEPVVAWRNPLLERTAGGGRVIGDEELDAISERLAAGALLAQKAGFDGADIKSCHGYLLSELLSARSREGKYGGCFENRTRMLRQTVADAISRCADDFVITTRLNACDGYPHGFGADADGGADFTEAALLAAELEELGVPALNITMGNPYFNPHVNRPYAAGPYAPPEPPLCGVSRMLAGASAVRGAVSIPVICSGLSWLGAASPNVAAGAIREGWFDLAGYGREAIAYPDAARDICRNGALDPRKICIACGKCSEIMRAGGTPGCVVRDGGEYLPEYRRCCMKKGSVDTADAEAKLRRGRDS